LNQLYVTNSEVAALFKELAQEKEACGRVEDLQMLGPNVNPIQPIKL
jgi:hypothetical protein